VIIHGAGVEFADGTLRGRDTGFIDTPSVAEELCAAPTR